MKDHKSKRTAKTKLELSLHGVAVEVHIPSGLGPFAERGRQAFVANTNTMSGGDVGSARKTAAELVVDFILYLASQSSSSSSNISKSRKYLQQLLWKHLEQKILADNDIHVYATTEVEQVNQRCRLISRFYAAQDATGVSRAGYTSAILRARKAGRARIFGLFGGQGNTRDYFEELRTLHATYTPLIADLIETCGRRLRELSADLRVSDQYPAGLDVEQWLGDAHNTPSTDHLLRAPVSFPLIGLVQLCYVKSLISSLGGSPGELTSVMSGLSGHSQGSVVAAALATVVTWEDFDNAALDAVTILFWIGARSQQIFRQTPLPEEKSASLVAAGLGTPSPMLSVTNIRLAELQETIDAVNSHLAAASRMVVGLINRDDAFVVSGPERTLAALVDAFHGLDAAAAADAAPQLQSRIAFSQRKLRPRMRFLPTTIPCHSPILEDAERVIIEDLKKAGITMTKHMRLPVNRTAKTDLATACGSADLVPFLVRSITTELVDWRQAVFPSATHIIDFGPGGTSGVGALRMENISGSGAQVIIAGPPGLRNPEHLDMGSIVELYDRRDESLGWNISWPKEFGTSLLRAASHTDKPQINSRMSRLLGLPPVMVAGMTPTTMHPDFVAAVMHAGYHVEFACGGYATSASLRAAILSLADQIPSGRGITLNVIYASPKMLAWQIPLIRRLRMVDQVPITGLTIGGGVPSVQVASDYIKTLGIQHLSLKPGSVASILQVIEIARQNPSFPVMLQWTGGRGGGHHSFEDFHAPILETYARIRQRPNIILIAGSGLSNAQSVYPYLWGSWSLLHGRQTRMPFDGVLLGSRVMACREAHTSPAAKLALAGCPGLADQDWEETYKPQGGGGIVSITSEMGQPMHVIATRGALLWAELDRTVFSVPRGPKRTSKLESMRDKLIARLNADFQKPWFARRYSENSSVPAAACELSDMTYADVARRILELCCLQKPERCQGLGWIDLSHVQILSRFLVRTQERLLDSGRLGSCRDPAALHSACELDPSAAVASVMRLVPEASTAQVFLEDVHYFVTQLCRSAGMKPVPFVPALDDDFETWFKKDSLWQSENLDAVGGDVGRVLILHGPVATRGVQNVDEPVAEVLDGIRDGIIQRLLVQSYGGDIHLVPSMEYLPALFSSSHLDQTAYEEANETLEDEVNEKEGPLNDKALRMAITDAENDDETWRQALLQNRQIFRGNKIIDNPLWTLTEYIWAQRVEYIEKDGTDIIRVLGAPETNYQNGLMGQEVTLVEIKKPKSSHRITISVYTWVTKNTQGVSLDFCLEYHPESPYSLIREEPGSREQGLYRMYSELWQVGAVKEESGWFVEQFEVKEEHVRAFNKVVGYSEAHQTEIVPMDFSIVSAWGPICSALLQEPVKGDLLRLVHLSNSYEFASPVERADAVQYGDIVTVRARQDRVEKVVGPDGIVSGCEVGVVCYITAATRQPIMSVRSSFLVRGQVSNLPDGTLFKHTKHSPFRLILSTAGDIALLRSKKNSWLFPSNQDKAEMLSSLLTPPIGQVEPPRITLEFDLETHTQESIHTTGNVYLRSGVDLELVGRVASSVSVQGNECPVLSYLSRHGKQMNQPTPLENPMSFPSLNGLIKVPYSNEAYSRASGDFNPIHTSRQFAALAGNHANTIAHGMYCSAVVRQAVERHVAAQHPERILRYETKFVDMVLPGDVLDVEFSHTAMLKGCMVVEISVSRQPRADGQEASVVISGTAVITQPCTALLFTGQGSQELNMGMDLYESSPVARAVWDEAEEYLQTSLGLSLLQIVRENPKSVKVHFGGSRGELLRQRYMDAKSDGEPMFPSINHKTTSYTHSGPAGLLFTTQFSQLAITVLEIATFRDMCAAGVVDTKRCKFAGHSLGEYAALAAATDVLPLKQLLPMLIARGCAMQKAVDRDHQGRSAFGMVAVDPGRVLLCDTNGSAKVPLSHAQLAAVVTRIAQGTGLLLEIVNLNVKAHQYVCAGELRALDLIQKVLDAADNCSLEGLDELVERHLSTLDVIATDKSKTSIQLRRGISSIPIAGVDIPFHSSHVKQHMDAYRCALEAGIRPERVHTHQLVGKYVPNVTGKPFDISRESFEEVLAITGSEKLREVVRTWDEWAERKRLEEHGQMLRTSHIIY